MIGGKKLKAEYFMTCENNRKFKYSIHDLFYWNTTLLLGHRVQRFDGGSSVSRPGIEPGHGYESTES